MGTRSVREAAGCQAQGGVRRCGEAQGELCEPRLGAGHRQVPGPGMVVMASQRNRSLSVPHQETRGCWL